MALLAIVVLVLLYSSTPSSFATHFSNTTDQTSLLAFKAALTSDPNNVLSNWTTTTSFCHWTGVSCSRRRQRVTALRLPSMSLGGTISPHIGNLSFLADLDLRNNSFRGNGLRELIRLRRLVNIRMSRNVLEGEIPEGLSHCRKLQVISLTKNKLTGGIPVGITTLPFLTTLFLGTNNLTGTIPASVTNFSNLEWLGIEKNAFHGEIPSGLGDLKNLKGINLWGNHFTGSIPPAIFNNSNIEQILLSENAFTGDLPPTTGLYLPNLEKLNLGTNQFTGSIPVYISNCSFIDELELSSNQFTGQVPSNLGNLRLLQSFYLSGNWLTTLKGRSEIGFLSEMTNCTSLEMLVIDDNPFAGTLPMSISNFSNSLQFFSASRCLINGEIPEGIGNLKVNFLALSENNLRGRIPPTVGQMKNLQRLYLNNNGIEGNIPDEICLLSNLGEIDLQRNNLIGMIPGCIGNITRLQKLFLGSNALNSSVPPSLWSLENLLFLNLSGNSLGGGLDTRIRPLKTLVSMDLSWNRISGEIPISFGGFQSLISLNLSGNLFSGPITSSFGNLITLDYLDLSDNNLSGTIPKSLEALSHLKFLNFSSNMLSGEIPSQGPFQNLSSKSFMNNKGLCGRPSLKVPSCTNAATKKPWVRRFFTYVIPAIVFLVIVFACLLFLLTKYSTRSMQFQNRVGVFSVTDSKSLSYQELYSATNAFSEENLIGVGGSGSVYKATLSDGEIVAVKVLNLEHDGALKRLYAECKVLGAIRHRNLVKVISVCSSSDFRALVLQYMPKGSLEKWLYSDEQYLDFPQRLSIMNDVALALEYLHHSYGETIVHCDLKPGNILLDEDLVGHVADFGIAKTLAENKTAATTRTLGTLGYIAPEYGSEGKVSTKGDVYSYGIVLLEIFTGRKPTDEMFTGDFNLREWVNSSIPDKVFDVLDGSFSAKYDDKKMKGIEECALAIVELGLKCSEKIPEERCDIREVVFKLNKIKGKLQSIQCS